MRASRLISLLLLLQTRGRMTAAELAEELEVSVRTVYRDVDALGSAGVPVCTERGPGGGCSLIDGYRTRLTGLTEDEAEALFLAGAPGPAAELGLGSVLGAAQLKLLAALPERVRETAGLARQRFHLDAAGWFRKVDPQPELGTVASGVWSDRRIRTHYRRADGTAVQRTLDPLGLVLKAGHWYLVARADGDPRVYRVARLSSVKLLEDAFERDSDFDLVGFWTTWAAEFEASLVFLPVTVRVAPAALERLAGLGDALWRTPEGPTPEAPVVEANGWTRRVLAYEKLAWAENSLLPFGADLEVIDPPALRERMAEHAHRLHALYGTKQRRARKTARAEEAQT